MSSTLWAGRGREIVTRLLGLALLCVALARPAQALAAEEPARPKLTDAQKQEIRERYDRATRYYYLRKYAEAVAEYEAIYLISADPVMLYNIAQSYRNADQPETASQFYKNYLRNAPTASNRADVEKKIAEMDRLVEERKRTGAPPPAAVATPPPLAVPSSEPAVGPPPPPIETSPPPAQTSPVPMGQAAPLGVPADVSGAAEPPHRSSHVLRWSLLVGGGVFLTTSLVLGSVASSKAKDVEAASASRTRIFDADLQKTEKDGRTANALALGTGLLGAVAIGAGVYLWVTEGSRERAQARTILVPVAGAGFGGALLRTAF
jgi:tetratricopeptide (TPR) repeat protein